jgi:hypothetical protein
VKKIKGLTKLGTLGYHVGMFRKDDDSIKFRWAHPLTILILVPSSVASIFWDGFRHVPELINELRRDGCLW